MSYKACGKTFGFGYIMCLGYQCGGDDFRSSECFKLVLEFDDENHLLSYQEIPWPHGGIDSAEEDMMVLKLADQGDALARSIWEQSYTYKRMISDESEAEWKLSKVIGTYCPNADLGHADAQKHIGDRYYHSTYEIKADLISAYVWYSLAVNGGNKGAAEQLDSLINELSTQQLIKAQIQLEEWEPGQCKSDLEEHRSKETRKLAEEGDAKAMYRVYRGMSDEHIEPVAAWGWLCKAADRGYENAQIEVAYWHRESNWGYARLDRVEWLRKAKIRADDRIAYLWYTLAAKGDDKRLRIRDNQFSETLSEKEIVEAKDMVSNWEPGQCQSGLMPVTSEQ